MEDYENDWVSDKYHKNKQQLANLLRIPIEGLVFSQICLTKIIYLGLSEIKMKDVPSSIQILKFLQTLNLEKNLLDELPTFLADLVNLNKIKLDGNPLGILFY